MALELFPDEVVSNLEKFKNLDMLGKYGFFESHMFSSFHNNESALIVTQKTD